MQELLIGINDSQIIIRYDVNTYFEQEKLSLLFCWKMKVIMTTVLALGAGECFAKKVYRYFDNQLTGFYKEKLRGKNDRLDGELAAKLHMAYASCSSL